MAYENLCMYCFKDLNGASVCPHCGKDSRAAVPQIQMLPGTLVYHDRFLVGRALGQDAGGIVYTALDTRRGGTIRIREYLPRNCAERLNDGGVVPISGMEDAFEAGMRKLRASVESVEDPKKRHFYFEENGTAYIAQRKNAKDSATIEDEDMDEDEGVRSRSIALYVAVAAAVVVVIAIAIIWFLNSMSDPSDVTIDQPLPTVSAEATWKPAETPTPTPYATATFAALKDPELSWMDYTYNGNVDQEYQQKQDSVQVTKKPTIIQEEDYGTVSSNSSSKSVQQLQERLASLGWLSASKVSGKYDSATKSAVKDFQRYVNDYCSPAKKLSVDGIAGSKTQQWLYNSSVSLVKPTATPTPAVTPKPNSGVIDASSPKAEVRALQKQLIELGLMEAGSADGSFGSATKNAVKAFQMRVNQIQGYDALDVTGTVDEMTQAYLDYYVDEWLSMKEEESKTTPTPKPTEKTETGTVNADSSKKEIIAVQEMLMDVGLLDRSDVDGVYGRGTVSAVKRFQRWVNKIRGVDTLDVTGECDLLTQRYLEYCVEQGMTAADATATPTEKPTPTPKPTEEPEDNVVVDADSPEESIAFVQEMLQSVGLLEKKYVDGSYGKRTVSAVKEFQRFVNSYYGTDKLDVTGLCDQNTLAYLEYAYENGWELGDSEADEPTEAPTQKPTEEPIDDSQITVNASSTKKQVRRVQNLLAGVGLLKSSDVDGGYGKKTMNAVKALQQYVNDHQGEQILAVTGECDPLTRQYLEYLNERGIDVADEIAKNQPTEAPTQKPEIAEVKGFSVKVDGDENDGSRLVELESGKHSFGWSARGGVDTFYIYLYDGDGSLINSKTTSKAGEVSIKASDLKLGEIYRLEIGALPEGGSETDIIWQTIQISRYKEIEATAEPTREPAKPSVGTPAISLGSAAYQQDGIPYISDDTVIFNWMAEGDVEYYKVTLYSRDGESYSLGETSSTSKSVPTSQLEPGLWKLEVGAMPAGGDKDDMKWAEMIFGVPAEELPEEPGSDPAGGEGDTTITYLDGNSDPEEIQLVQMALYKYGLINADEIAVGSLDEPTLEAVIRFQELVNERYGANLPLIDLNGEGEIYLDEATLDCLLYRELELN